MQCVNLICIDNPKKGIKGKLHVPCGTCGFCLQTKRSQWSFRLNQELKIAESAKFLTFTYAEEHLPISEHGEAQLKKKDFQNFMKRLRNENLKMYLKHNKWSTVKEAMALVKQLRYYAVGEYGTETCRPHYHAIMFNMQPHMEHRLDNFKPLEDNHNKINNIWQKGQVDIGDVTPASINYVTKYVITRNKDEIYKTKEFALMSRRPAIGSNYVHDTKKWHQINGYFYAKDTNGNRVPLPRFYTDKIHSKLEQKLNNIKTLQKSDISQEENRARLLKLGNNPEQYLLEQTNIKLIKLTAKATKPSKL